LTEDVNIIIKGSSLKELVDEKDSRGQGFKDSSEMLKNYKEYYQMKPIA